MRRPLLVLALFAALVPAAALEAQATPTAASQPPRLAAGTRVRVTTTRGEQVFGTLMDPHRDTLVLATGQPDSPTARMFALSELDRVETSQGTYTTKLRSGVIGMLFGVGVGALLGYVTADHEPDKCTQHAICLDFHQLDELASAAAGGILGGVAGGALGVFVGSHPSDEWRPVDARPFVAQVGVVRGSHPGLRLGGSISF